MIDVIIPTYNQGPMTARCFASIEEHHPEARILWIDNASDPRQRAYGEGVLGRPPDIQNTENLGFPKAVNQGLILSSASSVVIQNNDTELHGPVYRTLRNVAGDDGIAGPVSSSGWQAWRNGLHFGLSEPDLHQLKRCSTDRERAAALWMLRGHQWFRVPEWLAFFCVLIPRPVLELVGLLDERFGMGFGEDNQYCERAELLGIQRRLALGALVTHHHRTTWKANYTEDQIRDRQNFALGELERWRAGDS